MPDLDWIVEYETLPADEGFVAELEVLPSPPLQRPLPRWMWPLLFVAVVLAASLVYLWRLGGETPPLPDPRPVRAELEAIIQTEIGALQRGDHELWQHYQNSDNQFAAMQPPFEQWVTAPPTAAGAIELIDVTLEDEDFARATIKLGWLGAPYRVNWYYQQKNDRWVHFARFLPGPSNWEETLEGERIKIVFSPSEQAAGEALLRSLDALFNDLCTWADCPPDQPLALVTLYRYNHRYYNQADQDHECRIPSSLLVRWPWDGSPDPLLLGICARNFAYDLLVRPAAERLNVENHVALTLTAYWLAHHLAGLEPLPTTHWLDQAAAVDGLAAVKELVTALQQNRPPQEALAEAFRPETVELINTEPDYFGWLASVLDAGSSVGTVYRHQPLAADDRQEAPWQPPSAERAAAARPHLVIDPWQANGRYFQWSLPEVTQLLASDSFTFAITNPDLAWQAAFFFQRYQDRWVRVELDPTSLQAFYNLFGPAHSISDGTVRLHYWPWDEVLALQLLPRLKYAAQATSETFAISGEQAFEMALVPYLETAERWESFVPGRSNDTPWTWIRYPTPLLDMEQEQHLLSGATDGAIQDLMYQWFPNAAGHSGFVFMGLANWQQAQLEPHWQAAWRSWTNIALGLADPTTLFSETSNEWLPLSHLFEYDQLETDDPDYWLLYVYGNLVVDYIVDKYGETRLPIMLAALDSAQSTAEWVEAVTNASLEQFEADWQQWVIRELEKPR